MVDSDAGAYYLIELAARDGGIATSVSETRQLGMVCPSAEPLACPSRNKETTLHSLLVVPFRIPCLSCSDQPSCDSPRCLFIYFEESLRSMVAIQSYNSLISAT